MIKAVLFDNDGVLSRWLVPQLRIKKIAQELRKNGIKTGILSNINAFGAQFYKATRGYKNFSPVLLSYKERTRKPNSDFYEIAIKKLRVKPNEILFIDNRERLLVPARMMGMRTIHSKSTKQVIKDIKQVIQKENGIKL